MRTRNIVLLLLLVAGGGGIAWLALKGPTPTRIITAKAERVPKLRSIVSATGEIRAKEFVDIQAEVPGVIIDLPVHEGDNVKVGDILLRLDDLQLKAEEDAARAQLGAAEAEAQNAEVAIATAQANFASEKVSLANLKVELEQARTTRDRSQSSFQRKKELFDKHLIGDEEYEISTADARITQQRFEWNEARITQGEAGLHAVETRVEAARAMRDSACKRIDSARASLARATDLASKTVLRSPLNGIITKLNVEKGERAVPGIQSNPIATLMTIADMSVIEAEIKVDETDIVTVALDARAEIEVDALRDTLRDTKLEGRVTEIGQSPILATNTSTTNQEGKDFKVVVRLLAPPPSLRPGFTATADIVTATRDDCLVIPLQALTAREVEVDGQGNYVPQKEPPSGGVVVEARSQHSDDKKELEGVFLLLDGRARFRPVKTGITGEMDIEVLGGLQAGEQIVSGPYQALRSLKEWDRIAIDEKKQADDALRLHRKRR